MRLANLPAKWRALSAVALTYFITVFSFSMTFIVLPAIADDFEVTLGAVGWVVIVESLIVTALLLPVGSLADAVGRRRVLVTGMAVFTVGTLLTGLMPSFGLLIVARIVMALGNTLVQAIATGVLVAAFPEEERGLALGAQTTAVATGSLMAPLLSGLLLDITGWRTLYLLMALPAAVATLAVWLLIDRSVDDTAHVAGNRRFDRVGAVTGAVMITLLIFTINNPADLGWSSPWVIGTGVASLVLLATFVRHELRTSFPMLELRLFRRRVFRWAVSVRLVGFIASTAVPLLLPLYLLTLRDVSTIRAGVILAIGSLGMGISAQLSGRIYDRIGPRTPTLVGLTMQIALSLGFAFSGASTSLAWIAVLAFVNGLSVAMWNVANNSAMMGDTPPEALGVGGAFTNVTRTLGSVLGQALSAAIVVSVMRAQDFDIPLGDIGESSGARQAFIDGWQVAFLVAAGLAVVALVAGSRHPRGRHVAAG